MIPIRLRRELSEKGKECFVRGEHDKVLHYYNSALLYRSVHSTHLHSQTISQTYFLISSGKGVSHTLARRAAYFLSLGDHNLAIRDLNVALSYGGLEEELLDFLLTHHIEDEVAERERNDASIDNAINAIKDANLDMQNATTHEISKWANEIRDNLTQAAKLRKNDPRSRKMKDDITLKIINTIKEASRETNLDDNIEIEELKVPVLTGDKY